MDSLEMIYKSLTNVDIQEQLRIGDERSIGYKGEFDVFKTLYRSVEGNCKYLMNLRIPTQNGRTTEIDLLMIHETGIYVFEIKHYKGTIYGRTEDNVWTQFFRTASNHTFDNPVFQNGYHIRALKQLFPDTHIRSIIVFSNPECVINVQNDNPHITITKLSDLRHRLNPFLNGLPKILDQNAIEDVFSRLKKCSPLSEKALYTDSSNASLYECLHGCLDDFRSYKAELRKANETESIKLQNLQKEAERSRAQAGIESSNYALRKRRLIPLFVIAFGCVMLISCLICLQYMRSCDSKIASIEASCAQEIAEMEKNFQHVDLYNDGNIKFLHSFISITDTKLEMSKDLQDTVIFSCTIVNNGDKYGIMYSKDTKYIIMTKDGKSYEYDMFGERLTYIEGTNRISGSSDRWAYKHQDTLKDLEIYGIPNISDISYIKLTNISIWKHGENNNKPILKGLSLRLYDNS